MSKDINVVVYQPRLCTDNEDFFWLPVWKYKSELRAAGYRIRRVHDLTSLPADSDFLLLGSRSFAKEWAADRREQLFGTLDQLRERTGKLIWCDVTDSTGTTQFQVLPHVDEYWKMSLLNSYDDYAVRYRGCRLHTDFYSLRYQIGDPVGDPPHLNHVPERSEFDEKVKLSWNQGFAYFGPFAWQQARLRKMAGKKLPEYRQGFTNPADERSRLLVARVGTTHSQKSVQESRRELMRLLKEADVLGDMEPVGYRQYYREMQEATGVFSPFGFGEVCYRDFELVRAGAVSIKQRMDHCRTWPNLWREGESYYDLNWDFSNLDEIIGRISENPGEAADRAAFGQEIYRNAVDSSESGEQFTERFKMLLSV